MFLNMKYKERNEILYPLLGDSEPTYETQVN